MRKRKKAFEVIFAKSESGHEYVYLVHTEAFNLYTASHIDKMYRDQQEKNELTSIKFSFCALAHVLEIALIVVLFAHLGA